MSEPTEVRLKRLRMRCWRRGTKEMDLILGPFADRALEGLDPTRLEAFERLLAENDQDLYGWVSGRDPAPETHRGILTQLRAFHGIS